MSLLRLYIEPKSIHCYWLYNTIPTGRHGHVTKQVTVGRTLQPTLALAVNRVSYRELTGGGAPILSFFFFFLLLLDRRTPFQHQHHIASELKLATAVLATQLPGTYLSAYILTIILIIVGHSPTLCRAHPYSHNNLSLARSKSRVDTAATTAHCASHRLRLGYK